MQRYIPWMLWWATLVHFVIGALLVIEPRVAEVSILVGLTVFLDLGISPMQLGLFLIVISSLASLGLLREKQLNRGAIMCCLLPQYFVVVISVGSNAVILFEGEFHGRPFLMANGIAGLWPVMAGALLHTFALLERYVLKWVPRG